MLSSVKAPFQFISNPVAPSDPPKKSELKFVPVGSNDSTPLVLIIVRPLDAPLKSPSNAIRSAFTPIGPLTFSILTVEPVAPERRSFVACKLISPVFAIRLLLSSIDPPAINLIPPLTLTELFILISPEAFRVSFLLELFVKLIGSLTLM